MADSPKMRQLAELQAREEAILAGLEEHAEYPELQRKESMLAELDAAKARGTDFGPAAQYPDVGSHEYEYKEPNAPGAAPGRHAGPMAHELKSIPGVVNQGPDGFDRVDTGRLSLSNASATGELARADRDKQKQLDELTARLSALQEATGGDDPDEALRAARSGRY